jgi:hypothetical protein
MSISDIFSTSFLFSIAIIIILIGCIFAYVSYRISEQDHKLNSMIGLVSTMAEESQFFRSKLNMIQQKLATQDLPVVDKLQYASQLMGGVKEELIDVSDNGISDDEQDDEDEDEDEDDDVDINDSDSDHSDDEEKDEGDDEEGDDKMNILNLSFVNHLSPDVNLMSIIEDISIDTFENNNEIKTIHLELPIDLEEAEISLSDEPKNMEDEMSFLKSVSINDIGDGADTHNSKTDYKKWSLNKLREVVVSKSIISDASKLKKNEILKLLGDE